MSFEDALNQTIDMLRRHKRVSYRALRRQFQVDESYVEDLKAEIVEVLKLGVDEDGRVLVWAGSSGTHGAEEPVASREDGRRSGPASASSSPSSAGAKVIEGSAAVKSVGEHRHMTVMFCDLVDSTPLAERLDPEELAEVYKVWQDACAEAVAEHAGHIADYRGDGIFVYFGYPSAYEDAPHRALRAALGLLNRLQDANERLRQTHSTTLSVRIGIHTGLVLLSDLGGRYAVEARRR
jgi:class 3 adenylate cyclase